VSLQATPPPIYYIGLQQTLIFWVYLYLCLWELQDYSTWSQYFNFYHCYFFFLIKKKYKYNIWSSVVCSDDRKTQRKMICQGIDEESFHYFSDTM
jgi:hypothetical protein